MNTHTSQNSRLFLLFIFISATLQAQSLPFQTSTLFSGSGTCAACHAPGFPNTSALRGPAGDDISPPTLWRSTMMANAAKDPFWQAKVTAEVTANPHLREIIEDKCTTCHSPLGRTEAVFEGAAGYTLAEMQSEPLAKDGVSCTACHQIKDVNLGTEASFSGKYVIENDRIIYGPFENPFAQIMQMSANYTPTFSEHVHESEICATCHTLFTPYVDNNGEIAGEAPEQVPYLEWKNSDYPDQGIQCQTCHMPDIEEPVVISNRPPFLGGRSPFAKHYFVGGNVFMLRMLKKHGSEIGVTATETHFDSTIARTLRLLQNETAELSADYAWRNDSLEIQVAVKNLSGHKFPTAYPSRRAWVFLQLQDHAGQTLYESGGWDPESGEILGLDLPYEPHHDVITNAEQVQIYEAIMKDVDEQVNYTLLRAAGYLKDNRLPPVGFSTEHPDYSSAAIEGLAATDANFNRDGVVQGTGIDTVRFRIGGLPASASLSIRIKLLYQSLMPRFAEDLFQYNTPEVQTFKGYYEQADKTPITVDSLELVIMPTGLEEQPAAVPDSPIFLYVYPNPFNPETTIEFEQSRAGTATVSIFNTRGEVVKTISMGEKQAGRYRLIWNAKNDSAQPVSTGVYFVQVRLVERNTQRIHALAQKVLYMK